MSRRLLGDRLKLQSDQKVEMESWRILKGSEKNKW